MSAPTFGGGDPVFLTGLGGSADDTWAGGAIAVDGSGNIYVTGDTASSDFPVANAYQSVYGGGNTDAFVAKIDICAAGGLGLSPASLSFGNQATGQTSAAKTATLKNNGTQAVTISSIALSSGVDYAETHEGCPIAPAPLAGGANCTISVTFTPITTGTFTDEVVVTSDPPGSPHMLDLIGNGVPPASAVTLSIAGIPFADQLVSSTSDPQIVTVTNTGTADLLIESITPSGDFDQTNTCTIKPTPLAVDDHCTISVTFTPKNRIRLTGSISIASNAPGSPHVIDLNGKGVIEGECEVLPVALDFHEQLVGTSASQTASVKNIGDLELTPTVSAVTGDFSRTTSCTASLAGRAECTVTIGFTPTVTGTRDTSLTIIHDAGSPHLVTLKGTGTDFELEVPSGEDSKTVNAGQAASYNLQLAPTGFCGNVALACSFVNNNYSPITVRGANCSVPGSVTVNGTDPASFAVNVTTTARSLAGPGGPLLPPAPNPLGQNVLPFLLGLLMLSVAAARRTYVPVERLIRRPIGPSLLAAMLLFVMLWAACGGGSSPPPQQRGTPAGTYNLSLTATASGLTKTTALTLKVN